MVTVGMPPFATFINAQQSLALTETLSKAIKAAGSVGVALEAPRLVTSTAILEGRVGGYVLVAHVADELRCAGADEFHDVPCQALELRLGLGVGCFENLAVSGRPSRRMRLQLLGRDAIARPCNSEMFSCDISAGCVLRLHVKGHSCAAVHT